MPDTKHTQGEWWFDGREIIAMPSQVKVAGYVSGANPDEKQANARLIAAAPETAAERDRLKEINAELLASLEESTQRLCDFRAVQVYRGESFVESVDTITVQIAMNNAVIAKARVE